MDEIGRALEHVYDPTAVPTQDAAEADGESKLVPFAKVDAVAPSSPASEAVRGRVFCTSSKAHQLIRDCCKKILSSSLAG